jgi:hypothetical protein
VTLPDFVSRVDAGRYRIRVWVQPGAKRNQIAGFHRGCLKVRIQAPPVENKANRELIGFLAGLLGLRPNRMSLESGQAGRKKVILVQHGGPLPWQRLEEGQ